MNFLFFIIIWNSKELQVHPMKIFMHITFSEAVCFVGIYMGFHICDW